MKPITLLLLPTLLLATGAEAVDPEKKADYTLEQSYLKHGGVEQARDATQPVAKKRLALCKLCHGLGGNSAKARYPSLAGERPEYLLKRCFQIKDSGHAKTDTESGTAQRMSRRWKEEEAIALSLYYSAQTRTPVAYDKDLAAQGKATFDEICAECHQKDGRGKPGIPMIAGQQPDYLYGSLLQFRDNDDWRHGSKMKIVTQELSPIAIKAVANYAASLTSQ